MIHLLKTDRQECKDDAEDLLKECLSMGFDQVMIVGVKNNAVSLRHSRSMDVMKLLGALSAAKYHVMKGWI